MKKPEKSLNNEKNLKHEMNTNHEMNSNQEKNSNYENNSNHENRLGQNKRLSRYIDELNSEKQPKDHRSIIKDEEYRKLTETVRSVRSLRGIEYPGEEYEKWLTESLIRKEKSKTAKAGAKFLKRTLVFTAAAAAAAVLLFVSVNTFIPKSNTNIVYAMEKAMQVVKAYHGIIEVTETNELGETMTQSKREVWADKDGNYYVKELEGVSQGLVTANNGQEKWQLRPEENKAYLFQTFPDPYRFTFELGNEINDVKKPQTVKTVGEETISGREATILEVTPDGGEPYRLWIDNESNLPLQRESAMQNALQYKVTYSSIEFLDSIPQELLTYVLPEGYQEVNSDPEQIVATIEEAEDMTGFQADLPDQIPDGYTLSKISVDKSLPAIKLYYSKAGNENTVVIQQSKAAGELSADASAILGTVNGAEAEILETGAALSIRWQQQGMELQVVGSASIEELSAFAEDISGGKVIIPEKEAVTENKPQIEVPVDLTVEENEQKSVDAGHSPWKLDPVFVTQVFSSLLLTPEGIVGDYPIAYEDIKIIENNGAEAKAEINDSKSIAKYVYLKKLVRQDDTGIWTVVGYDKAQQD